MKIFFVALILFSHATLFAKTKTVRKVQEINFSEQSLKGTIRNPDGAYLVQKRGIKFLPLYDLKKDMDQKVRNSVEYVN
jgi:hypothetical protein